MRQSRSYHGNGDTYDGGLTENSTADERPRYMMVVELARLTRELRLHI